MLLIVGEGCPNPPRLASDAANCASTSSAPTYSVTCFRTLGSTLHNSISATKHIPTYKSTCFRTPHRESYRFAGCPKYPHPLPQICVSGIRRPSERRSETVLWRKRDVRRDVVVWIGFRHDVHWYVMTTCCVTVPGDDGDAVVIDNWAGTASMTSRIPTFETPVVRRSFAK